MTAPTNTLDAEQPGRWATASRANQEVNGKEASGALPFAPSNAEVEPRPRGSLGTPAGPSPRPAGCPATPCPGVAGPTTRCATCNRPHLPVPVRRAGECMTPLDAAWIREEVIRSYHWKEWAEDLELSVPANERNAECEPGWVPDEPYSASLCFCARRMGVLVGPGRIRKDWSQGYPYRHHQVWLAHARDLPRIAEHIRQQEDADVPVIPPGVAEQLDLFAGPVST